MAASGRVALVSALSLLSGCELFESSSRSAQQGLWAQVSVTYVHQGVGKGPALLTGPNGAVLEERRYEPFGEPVDALRDGVPVTTVSLELEPHNVLNKPTDPRTGFSYHGARWMAPNTARWLSPDPAVKVPDPTFMAKPWDLNPYQYVSQSPTLLWDPDGARPATQDEINFGARVVQAARERALRHGEGYAGVKDMFSNNPMLKGNAKPDQTAIKGTLGWNKCNCYVGDALDLAGAKSPLERQIGGGNHYKMAADWGRSNTLTPLGRGDQMIPGDVIIESRDGVYHMQVVTEIKDGKISSLGAHWRDGAGPSPLNDKRYTRALGVDKDGVLGASKRVNYDAATKQFGFKESDGTVDQIGVFRPKPDLLEPSF